MTVSADEVMALLRAGAARGDDRLSVQETTEGDFRIADPSGAVATVDLGAHWIEVRSSGPAGAAGALLTAAPAADSLIRVTVSESTPPIATIRGRVYLDGFSLHAMMVVARDVLRIAGPFAQEPRPVEAIEPGAEAAPDMALVASPSDDRPDEFESPIDREADAPAAADAPSATPEPGEPEPAGATASMPVESVVTPVAGAAAGEANGTELQAEQSNQGVRPTEAEASASERGTPIVPTKPSSVGATVQIPREAVAEALGLETTAAIAPEAEVGLTCRRCGAGVQPGERYCIACGAPQPGASKGPAAAATPPVVRRSEPDTVVWRRPRPGAAVCPRCGEGNPETNRYCQGCGSALRDENTE